MNRYSVFFFISLRYYLLLIVIWNPMLNMRLYISGSNLLTFAPFDLWDPEQGGGSGLSYPTQRVFNIGFQMTINNK